MHENANNESLSTSSGNQPAMLSMNAFGCRLPGPLDPGTGLAYFFALQALGALD